MFALCESKAALSGGVLTCSRNLFPIKPHVIEEVVISCCYEEELLVQLHGDVIAK